MGSGAAVFSKDLKPTQNVKTLQGSNDLSTLVTALKAGDLVAALQGNGPFTVFAPSNAAFAKLPKATLDSLLEPQNKDKLVDILTYHVVSGAAVFSKDLKATQNVKTLQGADVLVTSSSAGVIINGDSKVIAADIAATNGVVHIIDTVLMPPTPTTTSPRPTTTSFRPVLAIITDSALDQRLTSGVIFTLHILCVLWCVTVY